MRLQGQTAFLDLEARRLHVRPAQAPVEDWESGEALHTRLREAAELYSVTELEGLFNELAELGEAEARLAERLRGLRREHDIEGITRLIDDLPYE